MEREERIKASKEIFTIRIDSLIKDLANVPLADGIDQNSWLFAGCRQDLEKARTRIMTYIERCLK